jgi:transketolase
MSTVDNKPRLKTSAMIASIAAEGQATRSAPFGHAPTELARTNANVIGMTADLGKYTDLHIFAKAFPGRYYQMGMAEQLLMGAAAGFAHEARSRSSRPMRCLRRAARTTSFIRRSPRTIST